MSDAEQAGLHYVRSVRPKSRQYEPATWFDVRDAYLAGMRNALLTSADWLEHKEAGPDGLLDTAELIVSLRELADTFRIPT